MALIKCPECGKEISDKASACPNCGITMNDIKAMEREKEDEQLSLDFNYVFICPKCGNINGGKTKQQKHCIMCNEAYVQTDMLRQEYQAIISKNLFTSTAYKIDELQDKLKNEYVKDTIDEEYVNKTRDKQEEVRDTLLITNEIPKNVPKCPTCGSTNIQKISGTKRWVTTGLFGLASSNVGKTMECKNCGYKW